VAGSNAGSSIARADNLSVPSPGEWDLRLWREDAAGNQQPDNASLPVKLRFDPEPPKLRFESSSTEDPTRFSVLVTDPISGLGGGGIEISRSSSGVWQALPTTQESSRLVTRIDDASLPPGDYELRATAHDQAGNLASTDRGLDGKPMRVRLPLRVASSMRAGAVRKRIVRRTVRRGGEPHKVRRTVTVLEPRAKVRFGRRVRFAGQLLDRAGNPVGGAPIQIYSRQPEGDEHLVNTATTNSHGRFAFAAEARTSQRLRFAYAGTSTRLPVDDRVALLVSGSSTFEVSRSRILNGQSVLFSGRVRGRPLPEAGKLIELQVRLSDEWSTFQTIRSSSDGRWRIPYRFERACGVQRFRFRARLPGEASYPLESGHSRQLTIRVRGRPCFTG
jgi:5-hydroxyisourate hydrolase-like protein (transthyretin family)